MTTDAARSLGEFIDRSPTPFHAVDNAVLALESAGFEAFGERPGTPPGRYYVRRDGSLIAWVDGTRPRAPFRAVAGHTDSPTLRIRPRPDMTAAGLDQLDVEIYGGVLLNSWLDRDLGMAGRVVLRDGDGVRSELVRSDSPQLRVAQLAIHLDREVNDKGLLLDRQRHVIPIWATGRSDGAGLKAWLASQLDVAPSEVLGWDLSCFDFQPHSLLGRDGEFLCVGRLDDLASCHSAVAALTRVAADLEEPAVVILLDHEEVGSSTSTGAASSHVRHVLERRSRALGMDTREWLASLDASMVLSADMAHATHPNYQDRHEPNHPIAMGGGPVIKYNVNARYATDGYGAAWFKTACDTAGVPWQEYSHRGDIPCGSTIGPLLAAQLGVRTVDVGAPQLSMHSAREMMAVRDVGYLVDAFSAWFTTPREG